LFFIGAPCSFCCEILFVLTQEVTVAIVTNVYSWSFTLIFVDLSGYFLHDMIDIIVNGQAAHMWEVILHHIAVRRLLLSLTLEIKHTKTTKNWTILIVVIICCYELKQSTKKLNQTDSVILCRLDQLS